jgi:hypothetical protein
MSLLLLPAADGDDAASKPGGSRGTQALPGVVMAGEQAELAVCKASGAAAPGLLLPLVLVLALVLVLKLMSLSSTLVGLGCGAGVPGTAVSLLAEI